MTNTATGSIAGHATTFPVAHRDGNPTPAVFTATVSIPLSLADLTAALWVATDGGTDLDTLDTVPNSRDNLYGLALETLISANPSVIDALAEIEDFRPGTENHDLAARVRDLVATAFGIPLPRPAGHTTTGTGTGRELAKVAA